MKIYTKSGDKGKTSLLGGVRTNKTDPRIWAYGTVDEANSYLGFAKSLIEDDTIKKTIHEIQKNLLEVAAELASIGTDAYKMRIDEQYIKELEKFTDRVTDTVPPLKEFVIPGENVASGALHVARTVIRKAERYIVLLQEEYDVNEHLLAYINRLSDFVFIVARFVEL